MSTTPSSVGSPVGSSVGSSVGIVMPAFQEEEILESSVTDVVDGLAERGIENFELIVVENGSTDATATIADDLAARHPKVRALHRPVADYGAALRAGMLAATADVVVNFDTDYYDLDFLDDAVSQITSAHGPDLVVGSKRAPGAQDTRAPLRRVVTAVFSWVLRIGFGLRASDTHGIKAARRDAVAPIAQQCRFRTDLFDTELVLRVERAGLRTAEIPVRVVERRPARTSILARAPRTVWGLIRLRVQLWRERR